MKRQTAFIIIIVFSLLVTSTMPASASTFTVNSTVDARTSASIHQIIHLAAILNTLPDGSHDGNAGDQNQFSCLAEGWTTDPDDRSIDLNVRILSDDGELAQLVVDAFRPQTADACLCPDRISSCSLNLWALI